MNRKQSFDGTKTSEPPFLHLDTNLTAIKHAAVRETSVSQCHRVLIEGHLKPLGIVEFEIDPPLGTR